MPTDFFPSEISDGYQSYFGFLRKPFPVGFDFEFFCTIPRYDIIYNHLLNAIYQYQGVIVFTGGAGTGKTFLLRKIMQEAAGKIECVFCNYFPNLGFDDLLSLVCEQLGLTSRSSSRPDRFEALSKHLDSRFEEGRLIVLLIDEAQKLDEGVLSHLLTLSSPGFNEGRSMQIVLSGLPLLWEKLTRWEASHPSIADISEIHLEPLTNTEVADFIRQQLQIAGGPNEDLFPKPVLERIAHHTQGIPRLINKFCDHALLTAQFSQQNRISLETIAEVANDILLIDADMHKPSKSVVVPFPPATPTRPKLNSAVITSMQPDVQVGGNTDRAAAPLSLDRQVVTGEAKERAIVLPAEKPYLGFVDAANQCPVRQHRRWKTWVALFLVISVGAAGNHAPRQRYGFEELVAEAGQAFEAIKSQWTPITFRITTIIRDLKLEIRRPLPTVPKIVQEAPPPSDVTSITGSAVAEIQQAELPSERSNDAKLMSQPVPAAAVASTAGLAEAPMEELAEENGAPELVTDPAQAFVEPWPDSKAAPAVQAQIEHLADAENIKQQQTPGERVATLLEHRENQQGEALTGIIQKAIIDIERWKAVEQSIDQRDNAPEELAERSAIKHLAGLLARADQQFAARRLTTPREDNALATYREILRLVPGHAEAIKGIDRIKQRYKAWAEAAVGRADWRKAQMYYKRALRIGPEDNELIAALSRIPQRNTLQNKKPLLNPSASREAKPANRPEKADIRQAIGDGQQVAALIGNAKQGHSQAIAMLIAQGVSSDVADKKGKTGLMWAASRNHVDTVRMLLSKNADINKVDIHGDTALAYAAWEGHMEIALLLLNYGASVNSKNKDGRTPLINACINGHDAVVKLLLARGARPNVSDRDGRTPLMAAAWNGHTSIVKILLDNGANLNAKNRDGWTALIYSAWKGRADIVNLLVARGANVAIKNNDNNTASMVATFQGYSDVAQLLR